VLACQLGPGDRLLTFVPGKTVEYIFWDNGCTLSEGLLFPN
jgi:hypothetical protein